jgi:hypothetical protein
VKHLVEATVLSLELGPGFAPTRADPCSLVRRWGYRRWDDPLRDPREGMRRGGFSARIPRQESCKVSDDDLGSLVPVLSLSLNRLRQPRASPTPVSRCQRMTLSPADVVARQVCEE